MQAESSQRKDFGQLVVSEPVRQEFAETAARFHIPEYLLRRACAEYKLEHLRVVNTLWLQPAAVAAFARSWHAKKLTKA